MFKKALVFTMVALLTVSLIGIGTCFAGKKFDRKFLKMVTGLSSPQPSRPALQAGGRSSRRLWGPLLLSSPSFWRSPI